MCVRVEKLFFTVDALSFIQAANVSSDKATDVSSEKATVKQKTSSSRSRRLPSRLLSSF